MPLAPAIPISPIPHAATPSNGERLLASTTNQPPQPRPPKMPTSNTQAHKRPPSPKKTQATAHHLHAHQAERTTAATPSDTNATDPQARPQTESDHFRHQLFLLHTTLRRSVQRIRSDMDALTALVPNTELDRLDRLVDHISRTVRAHCDLEDRVIMPVLQRVLHRSHPAHTPPTPECKPPPPAKRHRGSSPVSIDLAEVQSDHRHLHSAFVRLRHALTALRLSPITLRAGQPATLAPATGQHACPEARVMHQQSTRGDRLPHVRECAKTLCETIYAHFASEEASILGVCMQFLTALERRRLLNTLAVCIVTDVHLVTSICMISDTDLSALLHGVCETASRDDLRRVAVSLAHKLPEKRWMALCARVPALHAFVVPVRNPLVGILHMHKAIRMELNEIVKYCHDLDLAHFKQMQTLEMKLDFLSRVHRCHSAGEEAVLFKEMQAMLPHTSMLATDHFHEDHHDEDALFKKFTERWAELEANARSLNGDVPALKPLKQELIHSVEILASHMTHHMHQEETKLLPFVQDNFSVEDQDRMMRNVTAMMPSQLIEDMIPWMFNHLDVDEQESMLRNLLRTTERHEMRKVIGTIATSVKKGLTECAEWNELCLRIPEIEEEFRDITDGEDEHAGPVSEILRVHKAFRIELNGILRRANELPADGSLPDPRMLVSLAHEVAFLRKMVMDHSKAEDEIILPRMEARVKGIAKCYHDDHCDERKLFQDLAQCLQDLQCAVCGNDCSALVRKLHALTATLRDEMVSHLNKEEQHMWPVLKQHFTVDEQSEIVALIFGQMSGNQLRELLPWMIQMLSVSERDTMMNHILQVTRSTLFETWLKTWLPLDNGGGADKSPNTKGAGQAGENSSRRDGRENVDDDGVCTALTLLNGRETMEKTIRAIASDASLSANERTRMMQQVMLAPYRQSCAIGSQGVLKDGEYGDREPTFTTNAKGEKVLGCKHYERSCKLRAQCCGKLYTCRLCHDEKEEHHIMNRYATVEMLCMHCDTLQNVSSQCKNVDGCGREMSDYYCDICKFFSNDVADRSIYHCPSCNVCRVGQGLGEDFFHCMKCNQCMSMKYQNKGHVCVEKAMESDCPICHQYLFTSTQPVKHLQCGHLMHLSCYGDFVKRSVKCPICSHSLEEMTSVFAHIDKIVGDDGQLAMPAVYRMARCWVVCLDCGGKNWTCYHFLYNKCPACSSYNTRVDAIDANGATAGADPSV